MRRTRRLFVAGVIAYHDHTTATASTGMTARTSESNGPGVRSLRRPNVPGPSDSQLPPRPGQTEPQSQTATARA
eukprot:398020-Rhodomonas_salina.1